MQEEGRNKGGGGREGEGEKDDEEESEGGGRKRAFWEEQKEYGYLGLMDTYKGSQQHSPWKWEK